MQRKHLEQNIKTTAASTSRQNTSHYPTTGTCSLPCSRTSPKCTLRLVPRLRLVGILLLLLVVTLLGIPLLRRVPLLLLLTVWLSLLAVVSLLGWLFTSEVGGCGAAAWLLLLMSLCWVGGRGVVFGHFC